MRYLRPVLFILSILGVLALAVAAPVQSASMGRSGDYNLDRLWSQAQKQFNLAEQDAVILLEARHVTIAPNGLKRTEVHRVVWVGSAAVARQRADLRIPWNSATSELKVKALRTWRDEQWWPHEDQISETAVVETLPYALGLADDYTAMRETMLLHDGLEIPCIMETRYEIVETAAAAGAEGLWIFAQDDPALRVELTVTVPSGTSFIFDHANGTPPPKIVESNDQMTTHKWWMENVARLGEPHIGDPSMFAPYVSWSTWPEWESLGQTIMAGFEEAAVLSDALADSVAGLIEHEPTPAAKVRAVAAFLEDGTRGIHYDAGFWRHSPRPAGRTWETAYGHSLDRAVLAAAMFREAGLMVEPVYRSIGHGEIQTDVPTLSRFEHLQLLVSGDQIQAFYDPESGALTDGLRPLYGRTVWKPATDELPAMLPDFSRTGTDSRFELILTVEPGNDGEWNGTGYLNTQGLFCLYDRMTGLDNKALGILKRVASSALSGTEVTAYNPEIFDFDQVIAGFEFTWKAPEADDQGRRRVSTGDPTGGLFDQLPGNIQLYQEDRTSPVYLPGRMTQRITVRFKTGQFNTVYLPEPADLKNDAGHCRLSVSEEDGWITYTRELQIQSPDISAEQWPQLRALLLEDKDPGGRIILMK